MAETKRKGDIGQSVVMARLMLNGYKVAIPVGEDWRFDLVVLKDFKLLRVQCKYVESDGKVIIVPCRSANSHSVKKYTDAEIDCIAVYDKTTDKCYYIPSSMIGPTGRSCISLRLSTPKNKQSRGILYARDFESW